MRSSCSDCLGASVRASSFLEREHPMNRITSAPRHSTTDDPRALLDSLRSWRDEIERDGDPSYLPNVCKVFRTLAESACAGERPILSPWPDAERCPWWAKVEHLGAITGKPHEAEAVFFMWTQADEEGSYAQTLGLLQALLFCDSAITLAEALADLQASEREGVAS